MKDSRLPIGNFSLRKTLSVVPDELKKAQIRIFYLVFMLNFVKWAVMLPFATLNQQLIISHFIGVIVTIAVLKLLLSRPGYLEILIHVALVAELQGVWRSVFLGGSGFHILTLIKIFMPIMWSFYGLGRRWGVIYSTAYCLIIPVYLLYAHTNGLTFRLLPEHMHFYSAAGLIVINIREIAFKIL